MTALCCRPKPPK